MRIVVASCSVIYTGRGDTKLNQAVRALIFKEDGSISVHNDKSNKPLNYMGKGNILTETLDDGQHIWSFDTRKESLQIILHHIIADTAFALEEDEEGLIRDGTENQLQAWIAEHPESLGEGYSFVAREYQTGAGAVDLLMKDSEGNFVAVEVKRTALIQSVDQVRRYVEALRQLEGFETVKGLLAALDVRPNTKTLADKRGIEYVKLPSNWRD